MIDVIILAIALSMDAFAVSIGLSSKHKKNTSALALSAGLYFGLFQALMPLLGYAGGKGVIGWMESYASLLASGLLFLIGAKMVYESTCAHTDSIATVISHKVLIALAIATSIDAMAAGVSLSLLQINPFYACIIIGIVTFCFSWVGVWIGVKSGRWLESKAELLGGMILILMGLRFLIT